MRRTVAVLAVLGAAALFLPLEPGRAGHNPVPGPKPVSCNFLGVVVATPGHIFFSDAGDGAGNFGGGSIAGQPVVSSVQCTGALVGTANLTGGFASCPNIGAADFATATHAGSLVGTTFSCHGLTAFTNGREAAYAVDDPTTPGTQPTPNGTHVNGAGTLASATGTVPLQDPVTGTTYSACSFSFNGHAIPAELDVVMGCGDHKILFPSPNVIGFAFLPDEAGDAIHRADASPTVPDFQHCATSSGSHGHVNVSGPVGTTWYQDNPNFVGGFSGLNPLWTALPETVRSAVGSANRPLCNRTSAFDGVLSGFMCSAGAAVNADGLITLAELASCLTTL